MRRIVLWSETKYIIVAIARSITPTITHANVALHSIWPSHNASAIVRAKAPTIMAHINSINDTVLTLFIRRTRSHRHHIRNDYGASCAVPR